MPAPFGFGVGDFVAVGTLAYNVYKSCKGAPGSFENISTEVLSLHDVLKQGEEKLFNHPLSTARAKRLKNIKKGCEKVLVDLQNLVEKYESLGTQTKRTKDRMRWANEDVAEIRARLISNISLLNTFISTSQSSVEEKLDIFIKEYRQGKRGTSAASHRTVDSLSPNDRAVWRAIRKDLEGMGISVAAFDANRSFIYDWFAHAVEAGAFEEKNAHSKDNKSQYDDSNSESLKSIQESQQLGRQQSPRFAHEIQKSRKPGSTSFDRVSASTYPREKAVRRVPRIAAFLAGMSHPRQPLMRAVITGDFSKALKILSAETPSCVLDTRILDRALWSATCQGEIHDSCPLLAKLIAHGANVNYVSSSLSERTPLWNSVANGSLSNVRLFLKRGVDVNYKGSDRPRSRGEAFDFAPRAALKQNTAMFRLLISSGVDVNVLYLPPGFRRHPTYLDPEPCISLIHEAATVGAVSALKTLLDHGAEIDAVSPSVGTALMAALVYQQEEAAKFLLDRGADPNHRAASRPLYTIPGSFHKHFQTPMEAAMVSGNVKNMRVIMEALEAERHKQTLNPVPASAG